MLGVALLWCGAALAQPDLLGAMTDALRGAPEDAKTRLATLLTDKYPTLVQEVLAGIERKSPKFLVQIQVDLDDLVRRRYPELGEYLEREFGRHPEVQASIGRMLADRYPGLLVELHQLLPGPDLRGRASRLVARHYPDLLGDVLRLLRTDHPALLRELQREITKRFPGLLVDVAYLALLKNPGLTGEIAAMVMDKHPMLAADAVRAIQQARAGKCPGAQPGSGATPQADEDAEPPDE